MSCFARTAAVLSEEFTDPARAETLGDLADNADQQRRAGSGFVMQTFEPWAVVPAALRNGSFAPLLLTRNLVHQLGRAACTRDGGKGSKCIPIYRTRFTYVFKISVGAWFATGAACMQQTNEGDRSGPFLVAAGIATERLPAVEARFRDSPCVRVPALAPAWAAARAYLAALAPAEQRTLLEGADVAGGALGFAGLQHAVPNDRRRRRWRRRR